MRDVEACLRIEPGSSLWPAELAEIEAPPDCLWLRGSLAALARTPRIAIVGTRAPTPYGEAQARRFAAAFAAAGVSVVSGLARGVDQAAHGAALAAGGATVAVLGNGVDRPWPAVALVDDLARRGALVSEFRPGEPPRAHHFPLRNRVISGLSAGVVVIEAAHASGSLITARWAADQGRSVYALPGRVDHPMARGAHKLIREGALLVEGPEDVLADLGIAPADGPAPGEAGEATTEDERRVLEALRGETLGAEELSTRLARPLARVLVDLVELEMRGAVARTPGGFYRRTSA